MYDKFTDREQAGKLLAQELKQYAHQPNVIVLALPRGGVPVAFEIACALSLPLDVFIVRKIGVPWHRELAMGAISSGGVSLLNQEIISALNISAAEINKIIEEEKKELNRRELAYRSLQDSLNLENKTVILVDDGIATGFTIKAAILALRKKNPAEIIIATPVAAQSTYKELNDMVNKIVCLAIHEQFIAVGIWYDNFLQTTDDEVCDLLNKAHNQLSET